MRIKKLEIAGFKSFADRAKLVFGDGITGVVGPNGCGKSNIVDAIRWCMGEMSAKHLRGRAMQDVIFAGSDTRGPLGMAEVTLTFHNDGNVPPSYLNYSEIAVTRRLHRDGESEYLLNKVPVRLRDITDLFLGTGVGTRAYSIIEQGRIGFIVNSRPEDRRSLIEEVAGITKFKVRKKAAERRMEATQANLLRVNDVVNELERQLGTLRRQAKKAERYKEVKAALRDLELHLAALDVLRLAATEKVHQADEAGLVERIAATQRGLSAEESGLEAERLRLLEEERRLQVEQVASAEMDAKLAALERDLQHWRRQCEEARGRVEHAAADLDEASRRIEQAKHERVVLTADVAELEASGTHDAAALRQARQLVESLQEDLAVVDEALEEQRRHAMEHVQGAAQQRTRLANLERQRNDLTARLDAARREEETLLPRQAQVQTRATELQGRRDAAGTSLDGWRERRQVLRERQPVLREQTKESARTLSARKDLLGQKRSRLASLEEIARRHEGYSDGVRTLLGSGKKDQGPTVPGLVGLVTDVLVVPPELERAIEAVLGERLQYLLVDEPQVAEAAIAYLQQHDGGRSGFIPVSPRLDARSPAPAPPAASLGLALDKVTVPEAYRAVATYLLGEVIIVSTRAEAQALAAAALHPWTFVTLAGEVVDTAGVIAGGADGGAGLLASRREIRELQHTVGELIVALQAAQLSHDALESERLQLEAELQTLDRDIHRAELEKLALVKDCEAAETDLKRLSERLAVLRREIVQRAEDLAHLDAEEHTALVAAKAAEAGQQDVEWRVAELQERRQIQATQLSNQSETLTGLKVRMASREEKGAAARAALSRLGHAETELGQRIERAHAASAENKDLVVELVGRLTEGEALAAQTSVAAQACRSRLSEARACYEADRSGVTNSERALKEQRRGGDQLQEQLLAIKMSLQKLVLERQALIEHVRERHDVDILHVTSDYHMRPLPDAATLRQRDELERSIKAMGPINLTAIEECAEVETRYGFLVTQRDDLQGAMEALRRAIARINRTSRERFKEAFDAVNEMFQKVYPRLFRGGIARLELTTSDDLLEAGVEIIAMPPGKKLQSVSLLSGGEKALTATALIFAIFLIKPSPFCILDEVDAPLDEANVGRFNEVLREISKVSQFIVITHNKNTMTEADRLYGITMEEPGMSKVVAVDLAGRDSDSEAAA